MVSVLEAPSKAQILKQLNNCGKKIIQERHDWGDVRAGVDVSSSGFGSSGVGGSGVNKRLDRVGQSLYPNAAVGRLSTQIGILCAEDIKANSIFNKLGLASPVRAKDGDKVNAKVSNAADNNVSVKSFSSKKSFGRKHRITLLSVEVLVKTRSPMDLNVGPRVYAEELSMYPDAELDAIEAIFWTVDDRVTSAEAETIRKMHGVILKKQLDYSATHQVGGCSFARDPTQDLMHNLSVLKSCQLYNQTTCEIVESESDLLDTFLHVVRVVDPDIIVGYDMEKHSLGYIIQRGKIMGSHADMIQALSRVPNCTFNKMESNICRMDGNDKFMDPECGFVIKGRILLNVWKRMRDELKLMSYTINNVADHVLGLKIPAYSFLQLSTWFGHKLTRRRSIEHVQHLCHLSVLLLDKLDVVRKTSECARLFGIDFYSVVTRGSQYRVEAAILRHCKASNEEYVLVSPSKSDVSNQSAMRALPLVMEPKGGLYHGLHTDPVVVLDFQSLYPSLMIAYNFCFSTCFGALNTSENSQGNCTKGKLGFHEYSEEQSAATAYQHTTMDPDNIDLSLENMPFISSNGGLFVSKKVRVGILPQLLKQCLECRMMIKSSMKLYKNEPILQRLYDARQLAIKLLMNVTYGYTSASFSGRMPMSELADAIVQTGRDMLNWTMLEVNSNESQRSCSCSCQNETLNLQSLHQSPCQSQSQSRGWGGGAAVCRCTDVWPSAEVVYGDTDSVFIRLPGFNRDDAHRIGAEIASYITRHTPRSMLLKFEKVYRECVLVSKKRYVGMKFESAEQKTGELDAKGIEMVRRDQCPAVMILQENALRVWFESRDLKKVREYLEAQWTLILQGKLTIKDFIFRREIKGLSDYKNPPPGVMMVTEAQNRDKKSTPPDGWRAPYVIVAGTSGLLLRERARHPITYLRRGSDNRLDLIYYLEKCINPALARVIDTKSVKSIIVSWYDDMKRGVKVSNKRPIEYEDQVKSRLGNHLITEFLQENCFICGDQLKIKGLSSGSGLSSSPSSLFCAYCEEHQAGSLSILYQRWNSVQESEHKLRLTCQGCGQHKQFHELNAATQLIGRDACESIDCSIFFERCKKVAELDVLSRLKV